MWVAGNLAQTFTIIASAFSIFQDRKKRMIISMIRDDQEVFFFSAVIGRKILIIFFSKLLNSNTIIMGHFYVYKSRLQ